MIHFIIKRQKPIKIPLGLIFNKIILFSNLK